MVTGTHGEKPEDPEIEVGMSGLTEREELDENFYKQDCKRIGIKTGKTLTSEQGGWSHSHEIVFMKIKI